MITGVSETVVEGVQPINLWPEMGTKMKGLLKGLRYISQIFDSDGKEQEMQIGFPTDVKHVAHIGWDGPSVSAPSWMNEYKSAPLGATVDGTDIDALPKFPSAEFQPTSSLAAGDVPAMPRPRTSRRKDSSTTDSPNRDPSRPSRRQSSSSSAAAFGDSPAGESSRGSRHGRRHRRSAEGSGVDGEGPDSPAKRDLPLVPKQSRHRRAKGTSASSGGSSRSSRGKAAASASLSEAGADGRGIEPSPPPATGEAV